MKKTLRFVLLSVMTMFVATAFAETVTFDFDNDYQTLFPTLAGTSSNESHDGDFTEDGIAMVGGVYLTVSAADEGVTNANRIWSGSPRLRMYSGTLSIMCLTSTITKIEFVTNDKFNLTSLISGTLDGKVWTGSDQVVTFQVNKNTQIKSIVVTLGEGGDNPGGGGDDDDDDGFMSDFDFTTGTITDNGSLVVFDFEGISKKENIQVTGKMEFVFENDICTGCKQAVTFPSEALAQAAYQESLATAEEDGVTDLKISGNTVSCSTQDLVGGSRIVVKCWLKYLIEEEEISYGTLESPFSPIIANILVGGSLQSGETTTEDNYVKGIIADIKYTFDEQHGTATFFISKDGQNDYTFQCYSVYFLENKPWVEGNTQIKLGDEVIVCGKLTNYQGTPETKSKKAYIYSLNGVTSSVNDIKAAQQKAVIYNLSGQRLEKAQKGLNIINGKKVMVK